MNLLLLSGLLNFFLSSLLSTFLFFNIRGKILVKIWAFYALGISMWGLSNICVAQTPINQIKIAYFWWRFAYCGLIFLPTLYYHFVVRFLDISRGKLLKILYIGSVPFFVINLISQNYFIGTLNFEFKEFYWTTGPGVFLLTYMVIFVFGIVLLSHIELLYGFFRIKDKKKKLQFLYFTIGGAVGWIGGWQCYLANFDLNWYPWGNFLVILYPILMGYAIYKYQLMDIQVIAKKTLVYSILLLALTTIFFVLIYLSENLFKSVFGDYPTITKIAIIILFTIIYNPLKEEIQGFIDTRFFHGSIDQIDEENTKLREELEKSERLKAVATLAAGMAHEIKNPLTSIKTFTEYIDKKKDDPDFINKFKEVVGPEVDRINHIVKQLLEFSKPSELELKDTNVNQLLNETLDLLNNNLISRNIKVNKHLSTIPTIKTDPNQIKQVFLNLLLNAIEAIKHNGTITISTGHVDRATGHVSITIKDNGIGISDNHIQKIFDPFYTNKDSGTGLGLSVVHGIIEKHKGTIKVFSKINEGTEFIITL